MARRRSRVAKVEPPQAQTRRQQALGHARRLHQLERARVDPDRLGVFRSGSRSCRRCARPAMSGQLERRRETGRPGADHQDRQLLPGGCRHTMRSRMVPASVCARREDAHAGALDAALEHVEAVVHVRDRLDAEEVLAGRDIDHEMPEDRLRLDHEREIQLGPVQLGAAVPAAEAMVEIQGRKASPVGKVPRRRQRHALLRDLALVRQPDMVEPGAQGHAVGTDEIRMHGRGRRASGRHRHWSARARSRGHPHRSAKIWRAR